MGCRREPTGNTQLETRVDERISIREAEKGKLVRLGEIQESLEP